MGLLFAAVLFVALCRAGVLGDFLLQRSWPSSANCDAGGAGLPTFSFADEGQSSDYKFNQCQVSADGKSSYMVSCFNATHRKISAWSPSLACSGPFAPDYPQAIALSAATNGCQADPGGSGGSTITSCIISASRYSPPASERNVALLFSNASATPPCSSAPLYTASSSGAALPACSAIAPLFASPANQPFASISYTTSCTAAGAPGTSDFSFYNASAACAGPKSASAPPTAFGTCLLVGDNLWWQQQAMECPGGAAAAAAGSISGGAIAGIVVAALIVLAGAAAAAYFVGVVGGGRQRRTSKPIFFSSKSNPGASFRPSSSATE